MISLRTMLLAYSFFRFYSSTKGLITETSNMEWPIKNCHEKNIDLVFVADTFTSLPVIAEKNEIYNRQMQFFSKLVSVFSSPSEINRSRLRVALLASTYNTTAKKPLTETRINFDSYSSIVDLKQAIEKDKAQPVHSSYPFYAMSIGLQTLFNERNNLSRHAEQVLILVVNAEGRSQAGEQLAGKIRSKYEYIRIFFVITAYRMPSSQVLTDLKYLGPTKGKVILLDQLLKAHDIPFHLCHRCYDGWFLIDENPQHSYFATCFKLFRNDMTHWLDANERCKDLNSTLVGIESKEKLISLTDLVMTEVGEKPSLINGTNSNFSIYIGLMRKYGNLNHFHWISKRSLAYTRWGPSEPKGGNVLKCVKWTFVLMGSKQIHLKSKIKMTANDTKFLHLKDNFWSSTGCGEANAQLYMCESFVKKRKPDNSDKQVQLDKPSHSSVASAFKRAQLVYDASGSYTAMSMWRPKQLSNEVSVNVDDKLNQTTPKSLIQFSCGDGVHISYSLVCDFVDDCFNRQDESICNYRKCDTHFERTCKSGQCVAKGSWCDLVSDCIDNSDEDNCQTCPYDRCACGLCQPTHWFGDNELDCNENSVRDEIELSSNSRVTECVFMCNRTQCVYTPMLGDGKIDCTGPEGPIDETIGSLESTVCHTNSNEVMTEYGYSNWAPKCIYVKDRYDESIGCRNMKHLQDCEEFSCPVSYFKCPKSYCIPTYYLNNGINDCSNAEDESGPIRNMFFPDHFKCYGSSVSIHLHPDLVCDGRLHCPRGDDEINCFVTCRDGFLCLAGTVTVDGYNTDIPLNTIEFVDPSTRYLNLTGIDMSNVFPSLPPRHFQNVINATLSQCRITSLNAGHFDLIDFESVVWLDLSFNLISNITMSNILRNMLKLSYLNLSHNEPMSFIHHDAFNFHSTSSLTVLDLSFTSISELKSSLLSPLIALKYLNLRNTLIAEINPNSFPRGFSLSDLDLRGLVLEDLYPEMFKNVTITSNLYTENFKLCCRQLHNSLTMSNSICHHEADPFSSCGDLMCDMILKVLLWVTGTLAIFGNLIVVIYRVFFDQKIFKLAYGHFVTHLSLSDLLMGIYLAIIAIADDKYRGDYMFHEKKWRSSTLCYVAGFLSTLSCETSTFFIFFITLDRFLVIKFPLGQFRISRKVMKLCCFLAWTVGSIIALIPVLPIFDHWTLYSSNAMCVALPLKHKRISGWKFASGVFIFLNLFMFILIALGQFAIYRAMSKVRMDQGFLTNASARRAQDIEVAKHLSLIAISDFMCWFPIGVLGILSLNGIDLGVGAYAWSAVLVLPINSAINPLIYTIPAVSVKWREFLQRVVSHVDTSS